MTKTFIPFCNTLSLIKLICNYSGADADNSSDDDTLTTAGVDDDTLSMSYR